MNSRDKYITAFIFACSAACCCFAFAMASCNKPAQQEEQSFVDNKLAPEKIDQMQKCLIQHCLMQVQNCHETDGCEKEAQCIANCTHNKDKEKQNDCVLACADYTSPLADQYCIEFFECSLKNCRPDLAPPATTSSTIYL
jgi:hypothetical protein